MLTHATSDRVAEALFGQTKRSILGLLFGRADAGIRGLSADSRVDDSLLDTE